MTVKELIAQLSNLPEDKEVHLFVEGEYYLDVDKEMSQEEIDKLEKVVVLW
jgi:hypothetical protein